MQTTPVIQAHGLSVGYRSKAILEHLDFSLMPGQIVALVGKNGIGKSTLIRTLTSELPPIAGQVTLAGKPLSSWTRRQLASMVAVACLVVGAAVSLLCALVSVLPSHNGVIPINAITPIAGVPVIIYIMVNARRLKYFN